MFSCFPRLLNLAAAEDLHLHDGFSHDGAGRPAEFAQTARALGLAGIGITNHIETRDPATGRYGVSLPHDLERLRRSFCAVEEARQALPGMKIKFGVEVENHPAFYPATEKILREVPFDYVIGSVHWVDGTCVTSEACLPALMQRPPAEWYKGYYREMSDFVEWGRFDFLGHPDVIRRYMIQAFPGFKPLVPYDVLRNVFTLMRERGQGVELNASGLFHAPADAYPCPEIVRLALECGIERIMAGSDAHAPREAGRGFKTMVERLLRLD